jgi:ribosome-associated toxin RatA of RatAB toxin-antitoxin module
MMHSKATGCTLIHFTYPVNMFRFIFVLLILFLSATGVRAQDGIKPSGIQTVITRVDKDGHSLFEISANGFVQATPKQVWQVLTDYERLPEFVPNLRSSKLISRNGNEIVLEQESIAGFLFVAQNIHLVLRVNEQPYSVIEVALVSGDMKQYAGRWELAPMEPAFFIPPVVGIAIAKKDVKNMMNAVVAEIGRTAQVK